VAKEHDVKAILNPAPACDLRHSDLSCLFALTPNETESRTCLGLPASALAKEEDLAIALLDLGPENVILTCGAQGVVWASRNGLKRVPALAVNPVDTVGAGDAFNAGLAVGLSEGQSMLQAIAMGVTTASLSTEKRETLASYPCRAEVDRRIHEVLEAVR
jgi:ribokinase